MSERAYNRSRPLDMGLQLHALRALNLPNSEAKLRGRGVRFTYAAQPTPLSRRYDLELSHHRGSPPEVCVLSPDLTALAIEHDPLPHVYIPRLRGMLPSLTLRDNPIKKAPLRAPSGSGGLS